ncbi:MAG TPA: alpha/beta hydrolase [Gemmatimonas aurantiaca]|uniref:Alpha/beta hydrolase n=1 Tax=Gemmatimonas aurantiaca TaxID=173480 RepID=A0A3D4V6U4_9BACT|nr:alpha/beta hydrolase [Gemmatimonas aurantiaca]
MLLPLGAPRAQAPRLQQWVASSGASDSLAVSAAGSLRQSLCTILLLPGTLGSAASMTSVLRALGPTECSVLVVDPLGMGASLRPTHADYSLSAQADRLHRLLERLLPPSGHVVVAAQGTSATIAYRLAARPDTRVHGIVSIAGGPVDQQRTPGVRMAIAFAPLVDTPIGRAVARRKFAAALRAQSTHDAWITSAVVQSYLAPIERDVRAGLRTLRAMGNARDSVPIADVLPYITAPVHLLVGDLATPSAPDTSQLAMLRRHVRHVRVDTVRGGGTMLHEEHPAIVAAALVQLIRGPAQATAP